jgi:hypothetical protein
MLLEIEGTLSEFKVDSTLVFFSTEEVIAASGVRSQFP